jgi:hypothetical protein
VRKTFTEVAPPARLTYLSLIDFVPDRERYEHLTTIDIESAGDRTNVVRTDGRRACWNGPAIEWIDPYPPGDGREHR